MPTGIPYTVDFTDSTLPGKTSFVIQPGTTDGPLTPTSASLDSTATTASTSLVIPGMYLTQYGQRIGEDLIHLLEHFAGHTAPVHPTIGQLWYNYNIPAMNVWDGIQWQYIGAEYIEIASTDEYNEVVTMINTIIGTPIGTTAMTVYGYGQIPIPLLVFPVTPTPANWATVLTTINNIAGHQGVTPPGLQTTDFRLYADHSIQSYGVVMLLRWFAAYETTLAALTVTRSQVDMSTLETSIPANASSTRTTEWDTTIEHQVAFTFDSESEMRAYFNTGGSIQVTTGITSNAGTRNAVWYALHTGVGTISINALSTSNAGMGLADKGNGEYTSYPGYMGIATGVQNMGFYSTYQNGVVDGTPIPVLYMGLSTSAVIGPTKYDGITGLWIYVAKNSATATLTVTVVFVNSTTNTPSSTTDAYDSNGIVGSATYPSSSSCAQTLTKASALYLDNPEISYPTGTGLMLLTTGGYVTPV